MRKCPLIEPNDGNGAELESLCRVDRQEADPRLFDGAALSHRHPLDERWHRALRVSSPNLELPPKRGEFGTVTGPCRVLLWIAVWLDDGLLDRDQSLDPASPVR